MMLERGPSAVQYLSKLTDAVNGMFDDMQQMANDIAITKMRVDRQAGALVSGGGGDGSLAAAAALAFVKPASVVPPVVPPTPAPTPSPHRNTATPPQITAPSPAISLPAFPVGSLPSDRTHRIAFNGALNLAGGQILYHVNFGTAYSSPPIVQIVDEMASPSTPYAFNVTTTGYDVITRNGTVIAGVYRHATVVTPVSESFD